MSVVEAPAGGPATALDGPPAVALVGSTASGKSVLAMAVARAVPGFEIVSVDAMAVYRGMDIGTAKPTPAERAAVPHHGLDLADPWEDVTLVRFQEAYREAVAGIHARGHRALLVGGTGLYLRAVVDDLEPPGRWPEVQAELDAEPDTAVLHDRLRRLDPVAATRMEPTNRRRIVRALEVTIGSGQPFSSFGPGLTTYPASGVLQVGLRWPREVLARRIASRYQAQVAAGFVDEVRRLAADPRGLSRTARQALGYREVLDHLEGHGTLEEAISLAVARTRRFAVRQERWFRRDPRIHWIDIVDDPLAALPEVLRLLDGVDAP